VTKKVPQRVPGKPPRSLSSYLNISVILPAAIVVAVASISSALFVRDKMKDEVTQQLYRQVAHSTEILTLRLNLLAQSVHAVAANDIVVNGIIDDENRQGYLPTFFRSLRLLDSQSGTIFLTDYKGRIVVQSNKQASEIFLDPEKWLPSVMSGKQIFEISEHGLMVAVPVIYNDLTEGAVVAQYRPEGLKDIFNLPSLTELNAIVSHPGDQILFSSVPNLARKAENHYAKLKENWLVVSQEIKGFENLEVIVGTRKEEAFALSRQTAQIFILSSLLSILVLLFAANMILRFVTNPIKALIDTTNNIGSRESSNERAQISGSREFQDLASTFNKMVDRIESTTLSLEEEVSQSRLLGDKLVINQRSLVRAQRVAKIGYWNWNLRTMEEEWSPHLYKIYGIDDTCKPDFELFKRCVHPDDVDRVIAAQIKHVANGESFTSEYRLVHSNGNVLDVICFADMEKNEDGEVEFVAGIIQDITQLRKAERKLKKSLDQLHGTNESLEKRILDRTEELSVQMEKAENANQAKSEFLASMSHEIRTPMTGVIGFADMLLEDNLSDESRDKVFHIKDATKSLLSIINDILDMSKMDAGKMELEKLDFHLPSLIKRVIQLFEDKLKRIGNVHIDWKLDEDVPHEINADPTRLRQIMVNLVGNAVKFTHHGHIQIKVEIAAKDDGREMLHFIVSDDGIGMSEDILESIFTDFSQADASISRKYQGTGLGLAICKKLTELSGGEIGVSSEPGRGSKFAFTIPYVKAKTSVSPDNKVISSDEYKTTRFLKILVAEDNQVNQMIIANVIETYGHNHKIAENGAEAVKALKVEDFDLILMDVRMPEMSGPDATRVIRQMDCEKSTIPIIALTADAMAGQRQSYFDAGMNECVTKPFERADLLLAINKVLDEKIHVPVSKVLESEISALVVPDGSTPELIFREEIPIGDETEMQNFEASIGTELLDTILETASESHAKLLDELRAGVSQSDVSVVHSAAHTIKGASASLFGMRLAELAHEIQENAEDIEQIRDMLPQIERTTRDTIAWWDARRLQKG